MDENKQTIRENIVLSTKTNFMIEAIEASKPIMELAKNNKEFFFSCCNDEKNKRKISRIYNYLFCDVRKNTRERG